MATEDALEFRLELADADAAELDRVTQQLRRELEELEIEKVEPISAGPATEGGKAVEWLAVGAFLVRLGPAAVSAVVRTAQAWVGKDAHRKLTIRMGERELVLDAATPEQQARLVEAFLADTDG